MSQFHPPIAEDRAGPRPDLTIGFLLMNKFTLASVAGLVESLRFADASHLIAWFRKQYGETTSLFRKRRREVERLMKG
ncbi:hypothetical protein [Erwinia sp. CGal63]|uniref:hypothetical protein n=1 Tax=Erwinia sp. CGal63 TaxID=2919889 RepID=UPI00300AA000